MRVALLAGGSSIHTIRWANGLSEAGCEVHLVTQHRLVESVVESVRVHELPSRGSIGYFTMVPRVRKLLRAIKPDLVNAHYASGYGTAARLVNYRPWLLSVWGSDVYDVPAKSPMHRYWVSQNIRGADAVASTSKCMANQIRDLVPELEDIAITPFGVDIEAYGERVICNPDFRDRDAPVVIGTVKGMAPKYGIDTLLKTVSLVRQRLDAYEEGQGARLRLQLVGGGPQIEDLTALARGLQLDDIATFFGRVPHSEVPKRLAALDIYVALSRRDSESFGVAILEAGAAGLPVVVSDVGGLSEVTVDGETGFVVPRDDPDAAADAILRLVRDPELRIRMGAAAREHVARQYNWEACVQNMRAVYLDTVHHAAEG